MGPKCDPRRPHLFVDDARKRKRRLSAGTLLNAQVDARTKVHRAVREAIAEAETEARGHDDTGRKRAAVLLSILAVAERLSVRARDAILRARQHARSEGGRLALRELRALGVPVGDIKFAVALHAPVEDELFASAAADSLATAWRAQAIAVTGGAARRGAPMAAEVRKTQRSMQSSIDRTATTEASRAFSEGHHGAIQQAIEHDPDVRDVLTTMRLMREWSALMDACPACAPHDGEQVPFDEPFSNGDEPGHMHPHCNCTELWVTEG